MALLQKEQELRSLFDQWLHDNGDETTIRKLSELAEDGELTGIWQSLLSEIPEEPQAEVIGEQHAAIFDKVYQNLLAAEPGLMPSTPVRRIDTWLKYAVAAAVLILVLAGGFWFFNNGKKTPDDQLVQTTPEGQPKNSGHNKAVLTLGNGKQIILDSSLNGQLAQQSGAAVIKPANGQIVYQQNDSLANPQAPIDLNTVSTPMSGEYTITLPDGTVAWLNAASSITFPVAFRGTDRTVNVQGEVYLQVAKNAAQPFRVKVKEAIIDVLGTEFNVNAYDDEPITRITLIEGSISLSKGNERKILKPGQQVWFGDNSRSLNLATNTDTEQVIAWKNGSFDFHNQDFETVMKQVGRWYNMEIVYEDGIPDVKILGIMSRNTSINTLLNSFELTTGIKFKIVNHSTNSKAGSIIIQR